MLIRNEDQDRKTYWVFLLVAEFMSLKTLVCTFGSSIPKRVECTHSATKSYFWLTINRPQNGAVSVPFSSTPSTAPPPPFLGFWGLRRFTGGLRPHSAFGLRVFKVLGNFGIFGICLGLQGLGLRVFRVHAIVL